MTTGIIIQARMESTRMPGKVLRPIHAGRSILDLMLSRLTRNALGLRVCVATPDTPANDDLTEAAEAGGAVVYRGNSHDVLHRFIGAAETFGFDHVVRVCGDNPLLDIAALEKLVERGKELKADYAGYVMSNGQPCIRSHAGLFAEFVALDALRRSAEAGPGPHLEHVTSYVYTKCSQFNILEVNAPRPVRERYDLRLTVDTPEDFALMGTLLDEWSIAHPHDLDRIDLKELIRFLDARPRMIATMREQIARSINRKVA